MNQKMRKGLLVAALHVGIVASLGAKLVVDRAVQPRVWARAAPVDPNLPIRGRYVSLRIEAGIGQGLDLSRAVSDPRGSAYPPELRPVALVVQNDRLVAVPASGSNRLYARLGQRGNESVAVLTTPVAYFIPEHAADPSRRAAGEELWVEVTLPRRGGPRPIRLGVKRNGVLTPLEIN